MIKERFGIKVLLAVYLFVCLHQVGEGVTAASFNAALNAAASADSVYLGYKPQFAVDGNTSDVWSRWLSANTPPPHWIELQFLKPAMVEEIKIYFFKYEPTGTKYHMLHYRIDVYNDGEWKTVLEITDNQELEPIHRFDPVAASGIRITFLGPSAGGDDMVRIREIEVMGRELLSLKLVSMVLGAVGRGLS